MAVSVEFAAHDAQADDAVVDGGEALIEPLVGAGGDQLGHVDEGGLAYGNDSTGSWEWEVLAENSEDDGYYAGGYSAWVADDAGAPHIAWFVNDLAAQNGEMWYATPNE